MPDDDERLSRDLSLLQASINFGLPLDHLVEVGYSLIDPLDLRVCRTPALYRFQTHVALGTGQLRFEHYA